MTDIVEHKYVYCYWVWPWVMLHLFGIVKQSPIPSLVCALFYNIWSNFFSPWNDKYPLDYSIFICTVEALILFIVAYNSKNVKKDFTKYMYFNIMVFFVYLAFLFINNKSFARIYFVLIPNQIRDDGNLTQFFKNKIKFLLS